MTGPISRGDAVERQGQGLVVERSFLRRRHVAGGLGERQELSPKDGSGEPPGPERNGERDFHGVRRTNDSHASTTDPDARLVRKGPGKEARLCFMGHALMENRNGLVIGAR